jgi:hypothetical protein
MSYLEVATVPVSARIWPHERRYRNAAQAIAQALFDALDDELLPYVQVLGLPVDASLPIVQEVGPDGTELPTELLTDVAERGRQLMLLGEIPLPTTPLDDTIDPRRPTRAPSTQGRAHGPGARAGRAGRRH